MSRRGRSGLPPPPKGFDPARETERADGVIHFETVAEAEAEDRLRLTRLLRLARHGSNMVDARRARRLANKLDRTLERERLAPTPASSRFMRKIRRRLAGWLWHVSDTHPHYGQTLVTLLCDAWKLPAPDLMLFDAKRMLRNLRSLLWSRGADKALGYLELGVHCEYFEPSDEFHFHVHRIAAGEMIRVIEGLRKTRQFHQDASAGEKKQRPNIKIQRPLNNLPAPYLYTVQSFAPRRGYVDPLTGEVLRGSKRRIPEPYHSLYLLWLDRYRIEDLVLLIGLRVTKTGLKVTR